MTSACLENEKIEELLLLLRAKNPTQYFTLIKMHLSFATDLATDQCDGSLDNSAVSSSRWNLSPLMRKFIRGSSQNQQSIEVSILTYPVVNEVFKLISFLKDDENITQEGLFRKTGSVTRQAELKASLQAGRLLDLTAGHYSAHDCASVLKNFLADLPEPLLQEGQYHVHCRIAEMCRQNLTNEQQIDIHSRQVKALRLVFLLLPFKNYKLLRELLLLLHHVTLFQKFNKMSSLNLGTMFAPHILCPRKMSPNELQLLSGQLSTAVAFIIENAPDLFQIPTELEIDIREYFRTDKINRQLSKRSMEEAPTKTSFTFVDRELTAKANEKDFTALALAELYAFVQTLPDSGKKKKLISQFNEASGQGTPKYNQNNHKKTEFKVKALGDSIKKHLFNRSVKKSKAKKQSTKDSNIKRSNSDDFLNTSSVYCSPELGYKKSPKTKTKSLENLFSPKASNLSPNNQSSSSTNPLGKNLLNTNLSTTPISPMCSSLTSTPTTSEGGIVISSLSQNFRRMRSNPFKECLSTPLSKMEGPCPLSSKVECHSTPLSKEKCPAQRAISTSLVCSDPNITPIRNPSHFPQQDVECMDSYSVDLIDNDEKCTNNGDSPSITNCASKVDSASLKSFTKEKESLSDKEDKDKTSPITRAIRNCNDKQKVMMTPRSRCPIIINSTSSLSSVNIQEVNLSERIRCDESIHCFLEGSSEALSLNKSEIEEYLYKSEDASISPHKDSPAMSENRTSTSLLGGFFQHLSASSLLKLATKLTSSNSHSHSHSTTDDSTCQILSYSKGTLDTSHDESLSSVFKEYLLNRSILTDYPIDLSSDNLACCEEVFPPEMAQDSQNTSSVVETNPAGVIKEATDSKGSNLSKSLLHCLNGNDPVHFMREPKRSSVPDEHECSPFSKKCKRVEEGIELDRLHLIEKENTLQKDYDLSLATARQTDQLHSCSPNGRSLSLLKNRNGTPVPQRDKDYCRDSVEAIKSVLFETDL